MMINLKGILLCEWNNYCYRYIVCLGKGSTGSLAKETMHKYIYIYICMYIHTHIYTHVLRCTTLFPRYKFAHTQDIGVFADYKSYTKNQLIV